MALCGCHYGRFVHVIMHISFQDQIFQLMAFESELYDIFSLPVRMIGNKDMCLLSFYSPILVFQIEASWYAVVIGACPLLSLIKK